MLRTPKAMKILVRRDEYSADLDGRTIPIRVIGRLSEPGLHARSPIWPRPSFSTASSNFSTPAPSTTSVQTIIPLAASSEVIFTWFYRTFVRRPDDPAAQTFLLGFDSEPIRAEKSLYDLAGVAKAEPALARALTGLSSADLVELVRRRASGWGCHSAWEQWRATFLAHLDRYGHAVYNLDFMNAVPADEPARCWAPSGSILGDQGANPYDGNSAQRPDGTSRPQRCSLGWIGAARDLQPSAALGAEMAPLREDALADVGLAWPQMRRMLGELGRRLVATGALDTAEDVYWLRTRSSAPSRSPSTRAGPSTGSR